jgi:putative tricarboxylic transport membrane protein
LDVLQHLLLGFHTALTPVNLFYALAGAFVGTIVGVLPGIGPRGSMAILLSFTLNMDATAGMIFFAGIYYGAMYGGSTTSILLNIPGEAASVVTCIDGYKMAQKGRGEAALAIAAVGSFVAGTLSIIGLMFAATALADAALKSGPPEFFAIGLVFLVRLSGGSTLKNLPMMLIGLAFGCVGTDHLFGTTRFTFGIDELAQGVEFLPVAMGLFGITEVMTSAREGAGPTVAQNTPKPLQKVIAIGVLPVNLSAHEASNDNGMQQRGRRISDDRIGHALYFPTKVE